MRAGLQCQGQGPSTWAAVRPKPPPCGLYVEAPFIFFLPLLLLSFRRIVFQLITFAVLVKMRRSHSVLENVLLRSSLQPGSLIPVCAFTVLGAFFSSF